MPDGSKQSKAPAARPERMPTLELVRPPRRTTSTRQAAHAARPAVFPPAALAPAGTACQPDLFRRAREQSPNPPEAQPDTRSPLLTGTSAGSSDRTWTTDPMRAAPL